ncbi:MAG: murein biosynthesis integral membrane protein MurJ [Deltaproteobacteria bacterium]|nr:murein biosynthesis integral membrane protein MurJ [Deltaproteobacteria bacterium]
MSEIKKTKMRALVSTIAIMGSRVFGLVREQCFAFFFGAGAVLDAFIVAFRIPNLLRDLFAEGALSQSFVTVFSQKADGDEQEAFGLANRVGTFIILLMSGFVILGEIFAPQVVRFFAAGFSGEKFELTVSLLRIMLPFILFVSLAALLMGMLHARNRFFISHSASTFFNIVSIFCGLLIAYLVAPDYMSQTALKIMGGTNLVAQDFLAASTAIMGMATGTLLGGLAQMLFQLPTAWGFGFRPKLDFNFKDPAFKKVLALTGPAIIGGAAVQVNVLVNTEFASLLAHGSISYLSYAFRFMQLPLGIFGVAIASASAPQLARLISQKGHEEFKDTVSSMIKMSLFLSIPSTLGLMILGPEIIGLIYQHGQFTASDTQQTAFALMAYALGISSYSIIKIYQPSYLAFHDAKTPMRVALFSILVNACLNGYFILVLDLPHWSLALGTASVATINLVLLAALFRKKASGIWSASLWKELFKILVAGSIMAVSVYFFKQQLAQWLDTSLLLNRFMITLLPVLFGGLAYFLSALLLGIQEVSFLKRKLLRR